ncbi:hypothetical protein VTK73DRAFT_7397 [Phialemonium thermophilum]|uniref:Uncharacterized protein n=1 Tax=Phialemonium thermophilum TaxID=223376 RepID=A0ABR3XTI2_9PEZI
MAAQDGEDVYATLLLTDTYLPGALVLAHSLRDAGTTQKLAVLVTLDSVSALVVTQLKTVYDYVIPVSRISNKSPANLYLMNRPDLHSAFTKINLWKQVQFRKIVYIDADVVAYRAPDELFSLPHAFSAAPDIGWPDLFNTGVMVLTPNMGDYYALLAMAERGVSFDGADQGLLNMYFRDGYHRLSFTYNVTPSAHYQYIPAYRHFQSSINLVHFIGSEKPWIQGRSAHIGGSPFDEMVGRWWAVYDKHYRKPTPVSMDEGASQVPQPPELVQYFVKGEYEPRVSYVVPVGEPPSDQLEAPVAPPVHLTPYQTGVHSQETPQASDHPVELHLPQPTAVHGEPPTGQVTGSQEWAPTPQQAPPEPHRGQTHSYSQSWDAQRQPPPPDSRPEAVNFPQTHYEMSSDAAPFVPPERYPSPPKNMWYDVPKEPPAPPEEKPKPIFPWETYKPAATRRFADIPSESRPHSTTEAATVASGERQASTTTAIPQTPTEKHFVDSSSAAPKPAPAAIKYTSPPVAPPVSWSSFTHTNAWDDMPEIERYVDALNRRHRRTRSQNLRLGGLPPAGIAGAEGEAWDRRGSKVTDFPSEVERPSLPVTPAPIRRPKFWGGGSPDSGPGDERDAGSGPVLPTAEGVPPQSEWDPVEQLQKLARRQSELLQQRFGAPASNPAEKEGSRVFGAEREKVAPAQLPRSLQPEGPAVPAAPIADTSPPVLMPRPVKPGSETGPVREWFESEPVLAASQTSVSAAEEKPVEQSYSGPGPALRKGGNTPTYEVSSRLTGTTADTVAEPSYRGPGPVFEKGEDVPTYETPALPTEEEQDVLET